MATYDCDAPARSIVAVGGGDATMFAVGTQRLRGGNDVHIVTHDRDRDGARCTAVLSHPDGEIWSMDARPAEAGSNDAARADILATAFDGGSRAGGVSIWRLPASLDAGSTPTRGELTRVASTPSSTSGKDESEDALSNPRCVRWSTADPSILAVVGDTFVSIARVDASAGTELTMTTRGSLPEGSVVGSSCSFHPDEPEVVAVGVDTAVSVYDARSGLHRASQTIQNAHALQVRSVEYNPKRGGVTCATCGDDGVVRIWDTRSHSHPVGEMAPGHAHWAWCVTYNPEYDQLIASSGGDQCVRLWVDAGNSSSAESGGGKGGGNAAAQKTHSCVSVYDGCHADTVYGVAWGRGDDPWTFASVSYDGRVAIEKVPRAEKYRILL